MLKMVTAIVCVSLACMRADAQQVSRIEGIVLDSARGGPLANATVVATPEQRSRTDTTFFAAKTDAQGAFNFARLPQGYYTITVLHPLIDSTNIGPAPKSVLLSADQPARVVIATPSPNTLRRQLCRPPFDSATGVILGSVLDLAKQPVAGANVVFAWSDFDVVKSTVSLRRHQYSASVQTDSLGAYRACGLPLQTSIATQAQRGAFRTGVLESRIGRETVLYQDLSLALPRVSDSQASGATITNGEQSNVKSDVTPTFAIEGSVTDSVLGPVTGAQVTMVDAGQATLTNGAGGFRLPSAPAGSQELRVQALGYEPLSKRVDVSAATPLVRLTLSRTAVTLDSVHVRAERARTRGLSEFDIRRKSGAGQFLGEQEIAATHATSTASVFRYLTGVAVSASRGTDGDIVVSTRGGAGFGEASCPLEIFIDGAQVRPADVNVVPPSMLHGIEIHTAATAPVAYHVGKCGAAFLWTR